MLGAKAEIELEPVEWGRAGHGNTVLGCCGGVGGASSDAARTTGAVTRRVATLNNKAGLVAVNVRPSNASANSQSSRRIGAPCRQGTDVVPLLVSKTATSSPFTFHAGV